MKKFLNIFFALAMILSIVFIGELTSGKNPFSAQAQVTVKKKKSGGLYGKSKRGVKYIYRKGRNGTVYVYRKTKSGTVYVGKKSYQGGKWVTKKTVKGTKKVISKTKKVIVG